MRSSLASTGSGVPAMVGDALVEVSGMGGEVSAEEIGGRDETENWNAKGSEESRWWELLR